MDEQKRARFGSMPEYRAIFMFATKKSLLFYECFIHHAPYTIHHCQRAAAHELTILHFGLFGIRW